MSGSGNVIAPEAPLTLRGVLITAGDGRLLLPNASVAEVITYSDPEPVEQAPPWLLGRVRWQGWRLPLVSFPELVGGSSERSTLGAKVAVLRLLGGDPKRSYFALLAHGFPRLVTVHPAALELVPDDGEPTPGVAYRLILDDEPTVIPDLEEIERLLAATLPDAA